MASQFLNSLRDFMIARHYRNTYYDIEGLDDADNEVEFDMLLKKDGSWHIAEVQRDLMLAQVPYPVAAVFNNKVSIPPERIIESDQGNGTIIYEFYATDQGQEKKYEVKLSVELLDEEWQH